MRKLAVLIVLLLPKGVVFFGCLKDSNKISCLIITSEMITVKG